MLLFQILDSEAPHVPEFRKLLAAVVATVVIAAVPAAAAPGNNLRVVRGTVGYQATKDAPFTRVFGTFLIPDDQFAVTQAKSNGLLVLADSSQVALGAGTIVQVGAITQAEAATPNTVTLVAGTLRFAVKHPAGGESNYRFVTPTSQIAVRGTIGLYSTGPNGDIVSCLDCAAGDVTVTAGGNSFALVTGQTATISITGVVTVAATAAAAVATFSSAGLSTVANSTTAFAGGIGGGIGASATVIGAGAAAAAGIGVAASSGSKPQNNAPVTGSATVSSHAVSPFGGMVPQMTATAPPTARH